MNLAVSFVKISPTRSFLVFTSPHFVCPFQKNINIGLKSRKQGKQNTIERTCNRIGVGLKRKSRGDLIFDSFDRKRKTYKILRHIEWNIFL